MIYLLWFKWVEKKITLIKLTPSLLLLLVLPALGGKPGQVEIEKFFYGNLKNTDN